MYNLKSRIENQITQTLFTPIISTIHKSHFHNSISRTENQITQTLFIPTISTTAEIKARTKPRAQTQPGSPTGAAGTQILERSSDVF